MTGFHIPPATLEGWYVLHQLVSADWERLGSLPDGEADAAGREFRSLLDAWSGKAEDEGSGAGGSEGWSAAYRLAGGGADFLLLHFRPTLQALTAAERALQRSALGDFTRIVGDYLSVVELGLYALTAQVAEKAAAEGWEYGSEEWREEMRRQKEKQRSLSYVQRRLYPVQPDGMPYVCFYPMDKRREPDQNWYTLPLERRNQLMMEHGSVGRKYADRISQVISGSIGLDDWEWAVTLFGTDPLDFKDVVSEMRFDEASAVYAEFGPFYVGVRMDPSDWNSLETW